MVGRDYEHAASKGERKMVVKIHDPNGRRLGTYPILPQDGGYVLQHGNERFRVIKGDKGPEKGKFYLTSMADAERLGKRES